MNPILKLMPLIESTTPSHVDKSFSSSPSSSDIDGNRAYKIIGSKLFKQANNYHEEISSNSFSPAKIKTSVKNIATLSCSSLGYFVLNLLGSSNVRNIGIASQATAHGTQILRWQSLPLLPYVVPHLSHLHGLLVNFNDPLRFPGAEGSVIKIISPSSTDNPLIHTKIYQFIDRERKHNNEKKLPQTAILNQPDSPENNLALVIDALIQAEQSQNFDTAPITMISDMLMSAAGSKFYHHINGEKKSQIIYPWIEQQIFGDDFDKYQRAQILNNRLRPENLLRT